MNFGAYTMEEHEEHESCGPKGPRAPEFAAKFLDKRCLLSLLLHRLLAARDTSLIQTSTHRYYWL